MFKFIALHDEVLLREVMFYDGDALVTSLFTFVYIYEPSLYQDSPMIKTFMDALHLTGEQFYHSLTQAKMLLEDDYVPSIFGFIPSVGT